MRKKTQTVQTVGTIGIDRNAATEKPKKPVMESNICTSAFVADRLEKVLRDRLRKERIEVEKVGRKIRSGLTKALNDRQNEGRREAFSLIFEVLLKVGKSPVRRTKESGGRKFRTTCFDGDLE